MPLLFSLAVHNALVEVQAELQPGEFLFAFLDDVYVLSLLERTRKICDLLADKLHSRAGIRLHTGKTRTWNRAAEIPEGMAELGPGVWSSEGFEGVGFTSRNTGSTFKKLAGRFLGCPICSVPWQLLVQCGGPRCHHFLRTVPPSLAREYAAGHDQGMEQVMTTLLEGLTGDAQQQDVARRLGNIAQ